MNIYNGREVINNKTYWIYFSGIFLVIVLSFLALFLYPWLIEPLGWGKTIIFRILLSVLAVFFLCQIVFKKADVFLVREKLKSVLTPFCLLVSFFVLSLLSTIFSVDAHLSLWGDPIRAGGFMNLTFYITFAILTFLVIRKNDWQKILNIVITTGILVSVVAIFQQFGVYKSFLLPFDFRPPSTLENSILLALYLLLLTFFPLSLLIKSKNLFLKIFYALSSLIFLSVSIFLTQTRSISLGLAAGFLWFLLAYPRKMNKIKIISLLILVFAVLGIGYLGSQPSFLKNQPEILRSALGRITSVVQNPIGIVKDRFSVWMISFSALKEKPILGYGPENFEIAFNKYYNPFLPGVSAPQPDRSTTSWQWWDRAHNFVFDISLTAGIPALIVYLSFLGLLLWKLQKIKKRDKETALTAHCLQATFIGYLVADFFNFDCFDTYLIFFLLVGYSFYLIYKNHGDNVNPEKKGRLLTLSEMLYKYRKIIVIFLAILLFWFIWLFNIMPLQINRKMNSLYDYMDKKEHQEFLEKADKVSSLHSIFDNYNRSTLADIFYKYSVKNSNNPNLLLAITRKSINLFQKNIMANPEHLRDWLLAGEHVNLLIALKKDTDNNFAKTPEMADLKKEADYYFKESALLSPKRAEAYKEWAKTGLLVADYKEAVEKAQTCVDLDKDYGACYWLLALGNGYLGNKEKLDYYIIKAGEKHFDTESESSLRELDRLYNEIK